MDSGNLGSSARYFALNRHSINILSAAVPPKIAPSGINRNPMIFGG
jgi:hypothetical protein